MPDTIWYGRSTTTTIKNTVDGLVYALVTAGTMGCAKAVVLLALVAVPAAQAQTGPPQAVSMPFTMRAIKAAEPPEIDGEVEDDEWGGAEIVTDFIQFEPSRGAPSPNRTQGLVLYDDTHLYVAFRAWDLEPLTAQLTRRDANLFTDDSVIVVIDTFHDRQTGYGFMTNPLGTQTDGRISDDDGRAIPTGTRTGRRPHNERTTAGRRSLPFP